MADPIDPEARQSKTPSEVVEALIASYEDELDLLEQRRPEPLASLEQQINYSNQAAKVSGSIAALMRAQLLISELQ